MIGEINNPLDLSFLANLIEDVEVCSNNYENFNFAESMMVAESFLGICLQIII